MDLSQSKLESSYPMILCIDDEPNVVDSLGRLFHRYKVRVTKALHGMQGIWLSQVAKPDLVLTDLKMPMCDGHELLEVVDQVPVVIVTGHRDDKMRQQLLDAGAADVLYKPVDREQLFEVIQKYISLEKRN